MSRLLDLQRRHELDRMQAALILDAFAAATDEDRARGISDDLAAARAPRSAAGDPARLRGIPMIAGAGGAVPGTRPGTDGHLARIERKRRARIADD